MGLTLGFLFLIGSKVCVDEPVDLLERIRAALDAPMSDNGGPSPEKGSKEEDKESPVADQLESDRGEKMQQKVNKWVYCVMCVFYNGGGNLG